MLRTAENEKVVPTLFNRVSAGEDVGEKSRFYVQARREFVLTGSFENSSPLE